MEGQSKSSFLSNAQHVSIYPHSLTSFPPVLRQTILMMHVIPTMAGGGGGGGGGNPLEPQPEGGGHF